MNIRNFFKLAVGITLVHIIVYRTPLAFENMFGDKLIYNEKPTELSDQDLRAEKEPHPGELLIQRLEEEQKKN